TLRPGPHHVQALYSGDASFAPGTSSDVMVDVAAPPAPVPPAPVTGDVTSQVTTSLTAAPRKKGKARGVSETLTLVNVSGSPLQGPVGVVLRGWKRTVKVRGAAGLIGGKKKSPFVVLHPPGEALEPGQSVSVTVQFSGKPNHFTLAVFAGTPPR